MPAERRIELGDARLQIAHEPDGEFNVIVVDAFSSDAIPAHLLTREAIALYLRKVDADAASSFCTCRTAIWRWCRKRRG